MRTRLSWALMSAGFGVLAAWWLIPPTSTSDNPVTVLLADGRYIIRWLDHMVDAGPAAAWQTLYLPAAVHVVMAVAPLCLAALFVVLATVAWLRGR